MTGETLLVIHTDDTRTIWGQSFFNNVEFTHGYMVNSLVKESPELDRIRAAVKKAGISWYWGYSERAGGRLYIA